MGFFDVGPTYVLAAKKRGLIPKVRPVIEDMMAAGLYLSRKVVDEALRRGVKQHLTVSAQLLIIYFASKLGTEFDWRFEDIPSVFVYGYARCHNWEPLATAMDDDEILFLD